MNRLFASCVLLLLAACASNPHFKEANRLIEAGQSEAALEQLEAAVRQNPRNVQYRGALLRERERVSGMRIAQGDAAARAERFDEAEEHYRAALKADPDNRRVGGRLEDLVRARHAMKLLREARDLFKKDDLAAAEQRVRDALARSPNYPGARELLRRVMEAAALEIPAPQLGPAFRKPVTLEFRDAMLKTVFDMLARSSGINFVFDRDVRQDSKLTVFMRDTSLEDALRMILTTNQLDHKVLNQNSVLVYPNTPAKQKDYRELVVRSYYLSSADVKQAAAMVKAIAKTQDIFIDEKLNLMVVKDTPAAIRVTDQLVRSLDLAEPEVMLEVELLEVLRSRLDTIGIQYPGSIALGSGSSSTSALKVDSPMFFTTSDPALVFNLKSTVGRSNLLANPRIRVKNKEKARVMIGDKVPVFTSTAANLAVATSVSYLDVGLKLEVEPQVYLNDEVAIKVGLEVSNIIEQVTAGSTASPTVAYRIGTRNANTVLQLRDGETQILAGLINDEDRHNASRIPGLGELPILDRIFGSTTDNKVKTEIVLLITPRVVRNLARPDGVEADMPFGTDAEPGRAPIRVARTAPGSMTVVPAGNGAAGGVPSAELPDPVNAPLDVAAELGLEVPSQAKLGSEFGVRLKGPPGMAFRDGFVELSYDAALVAPLGVETPVPGRVQVPAAAVQSGTEIRFRATAPAPSRVEFAVSQIELVDASGFSVGMLAPPPATTSLLK